ncbi:MFS transporter [Mycobacterium sp. AZCC_0083]|uniref:MFS transporter n=1 Tax=Mycobacterium sp. AZCC_0083 TaxID=2735882 RepID=UPI001607B4C4|nr:MFS transporter [Mycobacterium sp. AZCC_0083]MBB5165349.1 Na+/melibiose symporter-like transporter [Mycobacterium sp. AZCC_0083]
MTAPDRQRSGKFALSTPERIGFGVGSLATATYAVVPGLVLLYYLTNVLGVTAALAGFVVFLPKLLDLVYNPIVGRLSDSTVSRLGPRRPWMIAGMITFPLGFVSIFFSPFDGDAAAVWVAGALALTGLGFSAFVIPYSVLPAELGASPAERTSMTAWRMGFLGLAILAAGALAPMVADADGGGREGYRVMAVAMGCVIFLGTCGALYSARQSTRVAADASPKGAGVLREALGAATHNRPFRILLGVFMLIEVVISVTLAGLPYMADQILGTESAMAPLFVCVVGPMLVTMPVWSRAAQRVGKKSCLVMASTIYGAGVLGFIALPVITESIRFEVACAACMVAGIGFSGAQLLPQAMLADTLAVDATESGQRRAGVLAGLWSAGETISAAAGAGIYGFVLAASGFVSSAADESVVQPRSAEWGIVLGFSGISVLSIITALALLARYTLTEDQVDELALAGQA